VLELYNKRKVFEARPDIIHGRKYGKHAAHITK
jgi:hypothetical protein